jgi:hypothetical protein
MWRSTLILNGTIVVDGVEFRWSVTDGASQQLTVSHHTLGIQIGPLTGSPDSQARVVGAAMLRDAAQTARVGYFDAVDEWRMPSGIPNRRFGSNPTPPTIADDNGNSKPPR